jgi:hypothetical protein
MNKPLVLEVKPMEPIPPGANPYDHDWYRMGNAIGGVDSELHAMYLDFNPRAFVLVDTRSGQRWMILLTGISP